MKFLAVAILFFLSVLGMEDKQQSLNARTLGSKQEESLDFLSGIIGVPHGPKLNEILNAFSQNGYDILGLLEYPGDEKELRSFGFSTLHLKRWNDFFSGTLYVMPEEKECFETNLSLVIGVPSGPELKEIMYAFSQHGYNTLEDLKFIENEELKSFGLKDLHIKRCEDYFNTGNLYVMAQEAKSFDTELSYGLMENEDHEEDIKNEGKHYEEDKDREEDKDHENSKVHEEDNGHEEGKDHEDGKYYEAEEQEVNLMMDEIYYSIFEKNIDELNFVQNLQMEESFKTELSYEMIEEDKDHEENKKRATKVPVPPMFDEEDNDHEEENMKNWIPKSRLLELESGSDEIRNGFRYHTTINLPRLTEEEDLVYENKEITEDFLQPITIETLQGSWVNSNNNRFKVEGTSVKRNGAVLDILNETEDNIIIVHDGWVLDKMSGNFEWTDSHGTIVTWTRVQDEDHKEDSEHEEGKDHEEDKYHEEGKDLEEDREEDRDHEERDHEENKDNKEDNDYEEEEDEEKWVCDLCSFSNIHSAQICQMCEGKTPESEQVDDENLLIDDTILPPQLNEEENTSIEQRRRDEEILIREEEERLRFEEEQMMRFEMMRFEEEQMMRFEMMRFEERQQRIRFEEEQQRIRMEEERVMGTEDTTNIEDTTSIQNTLNMIEDFKNRLGLWIRELIKEFEKQKIERIQDVMEEVNERARKIWEKIQFEKIYKDPKVKKFIESIKTTSTDTYEFYEPKVEKFIGKTKEGITETYEFIEPKVEKLVETTKIKLEKVQNDTQSVVDKINRESSKVYFTAKNHVEDVMKNQDEHTKNEVKKIANNIGDFGKCLGNECHKLKFW